MYESASTSGITYTNKETKKKAILKQIADYKIILDAQIGWKKEESEINKTKNWISIFESELKKLGA